MSDDDLTAEEEDRWDAAYHEAGHAVIATVLGLPFEYVRIREDASGIVESRWEWLTPPVYLANLDRGLACDMAGGWAHLLSLPEDIRSDPEVGQLVNATCELDFERAANAAVRVGYTGKAIETRLDQAKAEARALVEANWSAIEAVATALYERGKLTEAEVHAIVEETPEDGAV